MTCPYRRTIRRHIRPHPYHSPIATPLPIHESKVSNIPTRPTKGLDHTPRSPRKRWPKMETQMMGGMIGLTKENRRKPTTPNRNTDRVEPNTPNPRTYEKFSGQEIRPKNYNVSQRESTRSPPTIGGVPRMESQPNTPLEGLRKDLAQDWTDLKGVRRKFSKRTT